MTKAYIMCTSHGLWMAFGTDPVEAAKTLPLTVNQDDVSVSGSYSLDKPIDLYKLWPYFTNMPSHTESK